MKNYKNRSRVGEINESNNYGPMEIIEDYKYDNKAIINGRDIRIRFMLSGTEKDTSYNGFRSGSVKDDNYFMYSVKDIIYESINNGKFKIIEDLGIINNNKHVRVKFIDTGSIVDTHYSLVKQGYVKDPKRFMYDLDGKIFMSNNCGEFKIIEDLGIINGSRRVKAQFIHTGSVVDVDYGNAMRGMIVDPIYGNVYQAREILGSTHMQNINHVLHNTWRHLMDKCYNSNSSMYYKYGNIGVTVCDEWHIYENFAKDAVLLPGWQCKFNDPINYNLDKDLLQYGTTNKVYSKQTCIWLHRLINSSLSDSVIDKPEIYYDNQIYGYKGVYYVKPNIQNCDNYGPFNNLEASVNMLNYCYKVRGINKEYPVSYYMTREQIFNNTPDRKQMIFIAK